MIQNKFCPSCAKPSSASDRFCQFCGTPFPDSSSMTPSSEKTTVIENWQSSTPSSAGYQYASPPPGQFGPPTGPSNAGKNLLWLYVIGAIIIIGAIAGGLTWWIMGRDVASTAVATLTPSKTVIVSQATPIKTPVVTQPTPVKTNVVSRSTPAAAQPTPTKNVAVPTQTPQSTFRATVTSTPSILKAPAEADSYIGRWEVVDAPGSEDLIGKWFLIYKDDFGQLRIMLIRTGEIFYPGDENYNDFILSVQSSGKNQLKGYIIDYWEGEEYDRIPVTLTLSTDRMTLFIKNEESGDELVTFIVPRGDAANSIEIVKKLPEVKNWTAQVQKDCTASGWKCEIAYRIVSEEDGYDVVKVYRIARIGDRIVDIEVFSYFEVDLYYGDAYEIF